MRLAIVYGVVILSATGCASAPIGSATTTPRQAIPSLQGSYHTVRRGETLWRIARAYGLDLETLVWANRLPSAQHLSAGQQLFIPLPQESSRFLWPVRGSVKPAGATGIEIAASPGSLVRASRGGRVAVATRQLSGLGTTVVLDHQDGYVTVYAGLDQLLVAPNTVLRQGMPLGSLGASALHFEIRHGAKPKNALAFLPGE
jgi:murein DD-endopeptidase MepM/ murein hydrolase activator NlpD